MPTGRTRRSSRSPGSGLGLSLVAAVARLHDAKLSLDDNAPGLRVTIAFPGRAGDTKTGVAQIGQMA